MKIIIPMAGMGSRLRPHTLTIPKPLTKIAGKSIVEILINNILLSFNKKVDVICFIISENMIKFQKYLTDISNSFGINSIFYIQEKPLGTAHSLWIVKEELNGEVLIAYSDTLFILDNINNSLSDNIILTKTVYNAYNFGVIIKDDNGFIKKFLEKPKNYDYGEAIIGIYYFNNAELLYKYIEKLIKNGERRQGEYELTSVLTQMLIDGSKFKNIEVSNWMDCGNKDAVLDTNKKILEIYQNNNLYNNEYKNSLIIPPCFIGKNVTIDNSKLGPYVSIYDNCTIINSNIDNTIINQNSIISNSNISNSIIGNNCKIQSNRLSISIGDYSNINI